MCGISAVYGLHAPLKALYLLTKQLERGTMGTGIAYICKNQIKIIKQPLHPLQFYNLYKHQLKHDSKVAIGHNRLPSIGRVTYVNTHPFMDCKNRFALAHNGHCIVTDLKDYLLLNNHKIYGETDSEILTHLLEELYDEYQDMIYAIEQLAHLYLSGAITVLTTNGTIYSCTTNFNPIHYTTNNREAYIASSQKAIRKLLRKLQVKKHKIRKLKRNQILEISNGKTIIHEFEKPLETQKHYWQT